MDLYPEEKEDISYQTPRLSTDRKYQLYEGSVQNPEVDLLFIDKEYRAENGVAPKVLREDFCGTGLLSCEWVKRGTDRFSYAIDLDPEPVGYGKENHYIELTSNERERVQYVLGNVLEPKIFKADVIVAFNFSYYIFKKRAELLQYFKCVREGLAEQGMFMIDLFGGLEARQPLVEETEHERYSYFWDCDRHNPLTQECLYSIHFKTFDDQIKYENVFTYDWRLWAPRELRDLLEEAGFSQTKIYWEGDDGDGAGDGNFYQTEYAENCESWVTYIVAKR
ncbi:MAG: class I SAM-dependent methyltransferase [Bacteriovoracaceae bacterium]|nr:class I SAM-dependent methyltransferase [Bacteriovoracaceae bacterium]